MPRTRVRLRDVAERAGVSPTTASFVLAGRNDMRISAAAQERVLQAATELNYRPNLAARGLRTKTTHTIGLISDTIATEQYAGEFIRGALAAALEHDHLLVIGATDGDPDVEARLVRGMLDRQVDGLIYGTMFTKEIKLPDGPGQHPLVLLNCLSPRLPGPAVIPDEYNAGRTAARALVGAGHRDGIYLVGECPAHVYAARERRRGITAELSESGSGLSGTVDCSWWPEPAYEAVHRLLAHGPLPRAFICLNDRTAMGVYQALHEAGIDIPGGASVVSFDDSGLASWLRPKLTSIALPHFEMGHRAAELLIGNELEPVLHRVAMPLRARSSIAAPG